MARTREEIAALTPEDLQALASRLIAKKDRSAEKRSIPRISRASPLDVSFAQERLWFIDRLGLAGPAYNLSVALRLEGVLRIEALRDSLGDLARRHESLRSRFDVIDGRPVQVVTESAHIELPVHDLTSFDREERSSRANGLIDQDRMRPFDLTADPPWRASLLQLAAREHVLLLTIHHIICDAWSRAIIGRELSALYTARVRGVPAQLPELPVQYADYAAWQRKQLHQQELQKQLAYWQQQLGGATTALELPTDRTRPAVASHRGGRVPFRLPAALSMRLAELARQERMTLYMVLLAAFQVLLARLSGQHDIAVGSPIAGRMHPQAERLIGFFVNTLVMRANLAADPPFQEVLRQVRETTLAAFAHQQAPFEKVVEVLRPDRDLSRQPLFQVMFQLQGFQRESLRLPDLEDSVIEPEEVSALFDLSLDMYEDGDVLSGVFEYAADLFERATIERWAAHFEVLLHEIVGDRHCRISRLPLLGPDARARLLSGPTTTGQMDPEAGRCTHELFAKQVRRSPNALAVTFEGRSLTYAELDRRSSALASRLQARGVGPEAIAAVYMERSLDLLVSILAIWKAGGVYLPLDRSYPHERLGYMLADSRAGIVLCDLSSTSARWMGDTVQRLIVEEELAAASADAQPHPFVLDPGSLAYVVYTSGSTGRPKGVAAPHRGLVNRLLAQQQFAAVTSQDVFAQKTSLSFVDALSEMFLPLTHGGTLAMVPDTVAASPKALLDWIGTSSVSHLVTVPSLAAAMLSVPTAKAALAGIRSWTLSGEALSADLCKLIAQQLPGCVLINLYGSSEVAADATVHVVDELAGDRVPIGRPIANNRIYVLDRSLEPVPIGVPGELYIGGDGLARGYLNRAGLTAQRYIANPFVPGARLYRTGDRVRYLGNGSLEFLGRMDQQVKVRGFRIELGEVEAALLSQPGVRQAVVVALDDELGGKRLVGYAVLEDSEATEVDLREQLKRQLPEYMVPSVVMRLESLPLTASGKVDRNRLPDAPRIQSRKAFVAPATATERQVAHIWAEALGHESVGIDDDFFELGGHSLRATRVIAQIWVEFGVEIPLRQLFERSSVRQLAAFLDHQREADEAQQPLLQGEFVTGVI